MGPGLARDIETDFRENYPHEFNVTCRYDNGHLIISSTNDYDPEGLNLMDEFSDAITGCASEHFDGDIVFTSCRPCGAPTNDN
jgi:hypothetical protein